MDGSKHFNSLEFYHQSICHQNVQPAFTYDMSLVRNGYGDLASERYIPQAKLNSTGLLHKQTPRTQDQGAMYLDRRTNHVWRA